MPRGGQRDNAGRKSSWQHTETKLIRVPVVLEKQILEFARKLDLEAGIESVTESDASTAQMELLAQEAENESVTDSKVEPLGYLELTERLGMGSTSTLSRWRKKPNFTELTRNKDPDGVGWRYDKKSKLHYPVFDLVTDSKDYMSRAIERSVP